MQTNGRRINLEEILLAWGYAVHREKIRHLNPGQVKIGPKPLLHREKRLHLRYSNLNPGEEIIDGDA